MPDSRARVEPYHHVVRAVLLSGGFGGELVEGEGGGGDADGERQG